MNSCHLINKHQQKQGTPQIVQKVFNLSQAFEGLHPIFLPSIFHAQISTTGTKLHLDFLFSNMFHTFHRPKRSWKNSPLRRKMQSAARSKARSSVSAMGMMSSEQSVGSFMFFWWFNYQLDEQMSWLNFWCSLTQPKEPKTKVELYFLYHICNPQKFKG